MPRPALRLFVLSFTALFLELMLIRWVPTTFKLVAYYANMMLISSFLGLGLGALSRGRLGESRWFPLWLAAAVAYLLLFRHVLPPGQAIEARFFAVPSGAVNYLALIGVFLLNVSVFVPLGRGIAAFFHDMPPLRAYAWDLAGSLCGTFCFGLFSFFFFSPALGMALVMALYAVVFHRGMRWWAWACFAATLALTAGGGGPRSHWSPYHSITVAGPGGEAAEPLPGLREMKDPPMYDVRVNQDFYQVHGTIDLKRYAAPTDVVQGLRAQYLLPYALIPRPDKVLVVGAGGGMDAEAALLSGAGAVDAVEIDPVLVRLSRLYSAAAVYDDPRVRVHVDDARAFLHKAAEGYDAVVYGFLDSQALFSSMSNVRLDGFVYTVEGLRAAHRLLKPGGILALSFYIGSNAWLADKLTLMLTEASGAPPIAYVLDGRLILCAPRGPAPDAPALINGFRRVSLRPRPRALATDDWPYLYLSEKSIPPDYLAVMGSLLAISLGVLFASQRGAFSVENRPFFFLGFGFLLLQTKSIVDGSLFFGATWLVTTLVVAGLLAMAMAANAAATRFQGPPARLFLPLLAALAALFLFPRDWVLGWPPAARTAWMLAAVPLPAFFAGMTFSAALKGAANPSAAFGANLLGATLGGFAEYLGMSLGSRNLSGILIAAYLAAWLSVLRLPTKNPLSVK